MRRNFLRDAPWCPDGSDDDPAPGSVRVRRLQLSVEPLEIGCFMNRRLTPATITVASFCLIAIFWIWSSSNSSYSEKPLPVDVEGEAQSSAPRLDNVQRAASQATSQGLASSSAAGNEKARSVPLTKEEKEHLVRGTLQLMDNEAKSMRELRIGDHVDQVEYEARLVAHQVSYAEEMARLQMLDDDSYEVLTPKNCDVEFFKAVQHGFRVSHSPAMQNGTEVRALFVFRPERFPELYALRERERMQRPGLAAALAGLFDILPSSSKLRICAAIKGELRADELTPAERRFLSPASERLISIDPISCVVVVRQ